MEDNNNGNKKPDFINEIVKEKKRGRKIPALKVVFVLVLAAAAGFVAALVFVFSVSRLQPSLTEQTSDSSRVSITNGSEADDTSEESAEPLPPPTQTPEPSEENITEIIYDTDLTVEEFENLNAQLYDIAQKAQNSVVDVSGITNQLDYFNESYENEQIRKGLIVA